MLSGLEATLTESKAIICMQKTSGEVFYQNQASRKSCGTYQGVTCPKTCITECEKYMGRPLPPDGFQFLSNRKVGHQHFDVLFFTEDSQRLVVLYPLRQKYENWLRRFQERNLSRREMEIANLCIQGFTNAGIAKELFISKATLKTHLNNLYKKMPEARSEDWRKQTALSA
jgi:hypothetical protein